MCGYDSNSSMIDKGKVRLGQHKDMARKDRQADRKSNNDRQERITEKCERSRKEQMISS